MLIFENKEQLEKFTLITIHGLFYQLKHNLISIENAEHIIFTPYMMEELSSLNVNSEIIDLIHKGTELEDLEAFDLSVQETVSEFMKKTEKLLKNYQHVDFNEKILKDWNIERNI
ncbi:DUF3969 family protein [Staphylococcus felis]|uniref:DUF3969 family protein n=2 Tax=Staphylococcus felis TaxID=46127 RepID=A0A2K3ZLW5_9STAP|nr:DUF3969 family protein [Staphylococcus felis]AVP35559.1 DUF3969 domain-containing protein [Staphylococcus felis]MBH9580370.1 DUF3969 family protein [Staphylococcus felis]PNZ38518.1 DUF3969 domain-containing protein [Staphylococcus felis]QQB02355.1 DUF3969 family protein [Staphylococcus felis]REH79119.1 DUF3969 family protein [Staphylococcus felis]